MRLGYSRLAGVLVITSAAAVFAVGMTILRIASSGSVLLKKDTSSHQVRGASTDGEDRESPGGFAEETVAAVQPLAQEVPVTNPLVKRFIDFFDGIQLRLEQSGFAAYVRHLYASFLGFFVIISGNRK